MQVCERAEAFTRENGELVFSYTKLILRRGNRYYFANTYRRYPAAAPIDLFELDPVRIPSSQIWPLFPTHFTPAPKPLPRNTYMKQPSLIGYGGSEGSTELRSPELSSTEMSSTELRSSELDSSALGSSEMGATKPSSVTRRKLLLREAEVLEILRACPHPHIVAYLGCVVEEDRISGLCLARYDTNLYERVTKDARPFNAHLLLRGIWEGLRHLHSLDLIHCDLNPTNILMRGDFPVVADFDACRRKGEKLTLKAGTPGWTNPEFEYAWPENDEYGLARIRDFLIHCRRM